MSTKEIVQNSILGFILGLGAIGAIRIGLYHKKHSNDPKSKDDDNAPIKVTQNDSPHRFDENANGLSRRKKSHTKSKKSRKIRSKK